MLSVTTWNVNGIRARQQDVLRWLEEKRPDVLCLQEIKASPESVPESLREHPGYFGYFHGHKGYSGVALLFSRQTFSKLPRCSHPAFDHETRIVTAQLGSLLFTSIYVPNGGKNLDDKVRFLDAMAEFARSASARGEQVLLCGDLNVTLEARDVHPSQRNEKQIGQTASERAQLQRILDHDLVDLARRFHPDDDRLYTWWAPWRNLRERNIGWRIDYVLASRGLAQKAISCDSFREFGSSDHGPVHATFDVDLEKEAPLKPESSESARPEPGQLPLF